MRTNARLDETYRSAFPVPFDDSSKFVFFADVHRADDSLSDEFGRNRHIYYHALQYYYQNDFTYVEVGDGDELWEQPKFDLIRNAHIEVFDMLKEFYDDNRLYILFGNHNMPLKNPDFVKKNLYRVYDEYSGVDVDLFPGITIHEALLLTHRETGQNIFVVHGHQGDLINDQLSPISHFLIRFFWHYLHIVGVKYAASPAKSRRKRHRIEKRYSKWNKERDTIILCGHTHRPKFPDPGEGSYFNCGCCMHPRGITCMELIYGKMVLVSWKVSTKKGGSMYIKRTALKGPEPIKNYR